MLRAHAYYFHSIIQWVDIVMAGLVFYAVTQLEGIRLPDASPDSAGSVMALGLASALIWPLAMHQLGLYGSQRRTLIADVFKRFTLVGLVATALIAAAAAVTDAPLAMEFAIICGLAQFGALAATRIAILSTLRFLRRRGRNFRNVVIVGSGPRAREVQERIAARPEWGLSVVGFIEDGGVPLSPSVPAEMIHKSTELPVLLERYAIDEVVVACPRSMLGSIAPIVEICADTGVPITLLSDVFGDYLPPPRVTRFDSLAALTFAPVHHGSFKLLIKRLIDWVGASVLLVALAPVILVAAVLIKLDSRGPVFFRQQRSGLNGRRFDMLKLRTMEADADAAKADLLALNEMDGPVFKLQADPRVTAVGQVLRRWSLDEIPQLWNVWKGDMSLVGPRPPIPDEVSHYEISQRRRLSMRPGLTCIWQVTGRNKIGFDDWVKLDLEYIDTWSLVLDFKLLLKTIPAVLSGRGAS